MACETPLYNISDFKEISWDVLTESTRIGDALLTTEEQPTIEKKRKESRKSVRIDDDIVVVYPGNLESEQPIVTQPESLQVKSLESRDNPFIPGGKLEQEADDLLKHATVIRDKFILDDGEEEELLDSQSANKVESPKKRTTVEEEIKPATAKSNESSTPGKPKENGKMDENASPDNVNVDNSKEQSDGDAVRGNNKDKKKQKKCCSIM